MEVSEVKQIEEIIRMSGVNLTKCIQCGKCSASCPMGDKMEMLPHEVVAALRTMKLAKVLAANTLWNCLSCHACEERCPKGVSPAALIEAARLLVIRQQGANRLNIEELAAKVDANMPQQALVSALRKYNK